MHRGNISKRANPAFCRAGGQVQQSAPTSSVIADVSCHLAVQDALWVPKIARDII